MKIKMAQYGLGHQQQQTYNQTPYTEQQFQQHQPTSLIDPPQYRGQSGGLQPQGTDGRGPAQETRYGATPVSTTAYNNNNNNPHNNQGAPFDGGNHLNQRYETSPIDAIRDPAAYGFQKQIQPQPETGFRFPGVTTHPQSHQNQMHSGVGAPAQSAFGSSDQMGGVYGQERERMQGRYAGSSDYGGAHGGQGFGYSQMGLGLGQGNYDGHQGDQSVMHRKSEDDFARPQPGYGQPGFGAPTQGANTTNLWPSLPTPSEAHKTDLIGQGNVQNSNRQQQQESGGDRFQGHQHAGLLYGHGRDRDQQQGYGGGENLASKEQYGTDGAPWQAGGVNPNETFGPEKIEGDQMHGHQHAGRGRDQQQGYGGGENLAKTEQYGTDGTPWQAGGVSPNETFEGDQKHGHQPAGVLYGQGGGRDQQQGYGGGENLAKTEQYGTDGTPWQAGGVSPKENFSPEKIEGDQKHAGPYGSTAVDATHGPYTGAKDSMTSSGVGGGVVGGDTDGYGDRVHAATRQKQSGYDVSEPLGDGYEKGYATGADAYLPGSNAESAMGFGAAKNSAATDSGLPESGKTTETRTEPGYDASSKLRLCVCKFGCNIGKSALVLQYMPLRTHAS